MNLEVGDGPVHSFVLSDPYPRVLGTTFGFRVFIEESSRESKIPLSRSLCFDGSSRLQDQFSLGFKTQSKTDIKKPPGIASFPSRQTPAKEGPYFPPWPLVLFSGRFGTLLPSNRFHSLPRVAPSTPLRRSPPDPPADPLRPRRGAECLERST